MDSDTRTGAHESRAFRFCQTASGTWGLSTSYLIGELFSFTNAAGGIGYQGGGPNQVWNMGDALDFGTPNFVYGLQGQDLAGEDIAN